MSNHPKPLTVEELNARISDALLDSTDMIGDLTHADAVYVELMLNLRGFRTEIETDTDDGGAFVSSRDWKLVRFAR